MIPFPNIRFSQITADEMQMLYEQIKTPRKVGAVIRLEDAFTDSPSVFRFQDSIYMYYAAISKNCADSGYETHLSVSEDLLHWHPLGKILERKKEDRWDSKQCAAYAAFPDITYGGSNTLHTVNGKYYISYLGGNQDGYEPDLLSMGLAKSDSPIDRDGFTRLKRPILRPEDPDARPQEQKTLYKSFLFEDRECLTGFRYVNAYNAKSPEMRERIFLAVSNDGEHWERFGTDAVIDEITGDPKATHQRGSASHPHRRILCDVLLYLERRKSGL